MFYDSLIESFSKTRSREMHYYYTRPTNYSLLCLMLFYYLIHPISCQNQSNNQTITSNVFGSLISTSSSSINNPFFTSPATGNNSPGNINSGSAQAQVILGSSNLDNNNSPGGQTGRSGWIPVRCNREPIGVSNKKTPGDNGFKIKISGNPEKYTPGEVYTGKCHVAVYFHSCFPSATICHLQSV